MAPSKIASLFVLVALFLASVRAEGSGISCSDPFPVTVSSDNIRELGTFNTDNGVQTTSASALNQVTCGNLGAIPTGGFWYQLTFPTAGSYYISLVNSDVDDQVATADARYIVSSSTTCTLGSVNCDKVNLAAVTSLCQGFPDKFPTTFNVEAGNELLVYVYKLSGTGTTFELNVRLSTTLANFNFDGSASLPAGWTKTQGTNSQGFRVGTSTQLNSGSAFTIAAPDANGANRIVGINYDTGCTTPGCDLTQDRLVTPSADLSASSTPVSLTFDYFYNDGTGSGLPNVLFVVTVEIGISDGESRIWTTLTPNLTITNGLWRKANFPLNSYSDATDAIFRFTSSRVSDVLTIGGFAINNYAITADPPICSDGWECTTDQCSSSGTFGCSFTPSDSWCASAYPATCYSKTCNINDVDSQDDGCLVIGDDDDCGDGVSCTVDTCSQNPKQSGTGCSNSENDDNCDNSLNCDYDYCLPDGGMQCQGASVGEDGCCHPNACEDDIICTEDACDTDENACVFIVNNTRCDDFIACTYELPCDTENGASYAEAGCISIPIHNRCDDSDPCTVDRCDPTLIDPNPEDEDDGKCINIPIDCDDGIACSSDSCFLGSCENEPEDENCDDGIECTVDTCDMELGKCTNLPDDSICMVADSCYTYRCRPGATGANAQGCVASPITCDDDIACTSDSCVEGSCTYTPHDEDCDDGKECTTDVCSLALGKCVNNPDHSLCSDQDCAEKYCDASGTCQYMAFDCHDDIACTVDSCYENSCSNTANNTMCDDSVSCTTDVCDTSLGRCTNTPVHSACEAQNCFTAFCDDFSAADGCSYVPIVCDDDIACTVDECNAGTGECTFTANDALCDDGVACTVDVCDTELGKCVNTPTDSLCDDEDSCTHDYCSCSDGCSNPAIVCRDEIKCTVDVCVGGECIFNATDAECDDGIPCTVDHCDVALGKCVNTPSNSLCDDELACTEDYCSIELGECQYIPHDDLCDDAVSCTIDACSTSSGCVFTPYNSLCDDSVPCTEDICDAVTDCSNTPRDAWCEDSHECTSWTCDAINNCVVALDNSACDDEVSCTDDYCTIEEGCVNMSNDTLCSDGIGCTSDICNPSTGECEHVPVNELCSDGFECSVDTCNATAGCTIDFQACPWYNLGADEDICLSCISAGTRINQLTYHDGTGAMQFQTRVTPLLSNDGTNAGLKTNVLMTPTGQFVVGANYQDDENVRVHKEDGMVVNGNLRLVPTTEDLPLCGEVSRGTLAVKSEEVPCGENICLHDKLYLCSKLQNYEWVPVAY